MKKEKIFFYGLLIIGTIISLYFIIRVAIDGYCIWGEQIKYEVTGLFGDFIGGVVGTVFALAGTVLIFMTFTEQLSFNKSQQLVNEYNLMFSISENIEKLVREFKIDTFDIKDNSKITITDIENIKELENKNLEEGTFMNIYNRICNISNICLLAYEINENQISESAKKTFKSIIWTYSTYVCAFWGLCIIDNSTQSAKIDIYKQSDGQPIELDTLKIKQTEILKYIENFKKYVLLISARANL